MSIGNSHIVRARLRSPRATAIAGILFSLLLSTSIILVRNITTITPGVIDRAGLETGATTASLAIFLIPFAGIAFLWFTGVILDWAEQQEQEDRLFATLFLGSGILIVAMLFVWAAIFGAIFSTYAMLADRLEDDTVLVFGSMIMDQILGIYIVMMMGMYMLSVATLWIRTKSMPLWLTIITYILAIVFIFLTGMITGGRLIFPIWVFFISVYILVLNFFGSRKPEGEKKRFLEN